MSDIALRFGARDDGLTAQFRRINQGMEAVERTAKGVSASISGMFGNLKGVIGGFSLGFATREVMQFSSEIKDAWIQTGITVDRIQKLNFISTQTGSDLSSITSAVNRMQKSLVLMGEGSDKSAASLGRLGLPVERFMSMAPDVQFQEVARRIASIEDPAKRVTVAMDLFGKSGAELLPTLVGTGKELVQIEKNFATIGGPVAQGAIFKVAEMGDTLSATGTAAKSLGTELLALTAPGIIGGLNLLNTTIGALRFMLRGGEGDNEQVNLSNEIDRLNGRISYFRSVMEHDPNAKSIVEQATKDVEVLMAQLEKLQNGDAVARALGQSRGPTSRRRAPRDLGDLSNLPDTSGKLEQPKQKKETFLTPDAASQDEFARQSFNERMLAEQDEANRRFREANEAHLEQLLGQELGYTDARLQSQTALQSALADLRQQYGIAEIDFESFKSMSIQQINASLASSLLTIAASAFGQNKKVALAVAGVSIGVGMAKALELPFPANLAAAAKVAAQGAQILSGIRSANIGSGASVGGVSGGSAIGSGTPDAAQSIAEGAKSAPSTAIYINGNFAGPRSMDWLVEELRKATDRDVVLIGGNNRQSIDFRDDD